MYLREASTLLVTWNPHHKISDTQTISMIESLVKVYCTGTLSSLPVLFTL